MRLGVQAALVDGELVPGDVEVVDGAIAAVGLAPSGGGRLAAPGFVDLQVNGFAGVDFLDASAADYQQVGEALLATGVTAYQPTFVSSGEPQIHDALAEMTAASAVTARSPRIIGAHLEGPFLSSLWAGAHDPAHLQPPDRALIERLSSSGRVASVTLAPELPGALELIGWLVERGVVVWLGHSDADAGVAHQAFDLGARAVTHLFNAHRRFQPRDPALAGAALSRTDVFVGVIADLVHLAPETVRLASAAAADRVVLVTDATAAAGRPAGDYELAGRRVRSDGRAVHIGDTLAGSALTMDQAVRNLVDVGVSLEAALRAATIAPARLMGRPERASLAPGAQADVVVLDDNLLPAQVLVGGQVCLDRG